MTGLEKALLDADEALVRPQVRAALEALHAAGLELLDERGEATPYDLAGLLLPGVLEVPGNTERFRRLAASSLRVYGPPACPAVGTGAEVVAHQAAADLQAEGPPSPAQVAAWDVLRDLIATESSQILLDGVAVRLGRPLTRAEKCEILEEREALVDALAARIALATERP